MSEPPEPTTKDLIDAGNGELADELHWRLAKALESEIAALGECEKTLRVEKALHEIAAKDYIKMAATAVEIRDERDAAIKQAEEAEALVLMMAKVLESLQSMLKSYPYQEPDIAEESIRPCRNL